MSILGKNTVSGKPEPINSTAGSLNVNLTNPGGGTPAVVLTDATANPTTTSAGALMYGYNGTTWDRLRTGVTGVFTSALGFLNVLSVGRFNASPLTLADGNLAILQLDANANLKVTASIPGVLTSGGGTLATASTSQQIFGINATRRYLTVQNNSTADMWVNFGVAATLSQPSIRLLPSGAITFENNLIPNTTVTIIGATVGQAYSAFQA